MMKRKPGTYKFKCWDGGNVVLTSCSEESGEEGEQDFQEEEGQQI